MWYCSFIFQCSLGVFFIPEMRLPSRIKTNCLPLCRILCFPLKCHVWCLSRRSMNFGGATHTWDNRGEWLTGNCWLSQKEKETQELLRKRIIYFRQWEWITEKMQEAQLLAKRVLGAALVGTLARGLVFYEKRHRGVFFFLFIFAADTSLI